MNIDEEECSEAFVDTPPPPQNPFSVSHRKFYPPPPQNKIKKNQDDDDDDFEDSDPILSCSKCVRILFFKF